MADEAWPAEEIPNSDTLFMRIHKSWLTNGDLLPGAFRDQGAGMSTNWQKYCHTPEGARQKAKNPAHNGVISLNVGGVRNIPLLTVKHTPNVELNDRSHTDVIGKKDSEVRLKLLKLYQWEIPAPN